MARKGDYGNPIELHGCKAWAWPNVFRKDGTVSRHTQDWCWAIETPNGQVAWTDKGASTRASALDMCRGRIERAFGPDAQDRDYYLAKYSAQA